MASALDPAPGLALVGNGQGVRAGIGAHRAAQLEDIHRRMPELLFAELFQLLEFFRVIGVGQLVFGIGQAFHPALHILDHGRSHSRVSPHLGLHPGLAVDQADDGAQAQQLARKSGGSGLGLALCSSIAQAHGTELRIRSREGRGTCITVTLTPCPPQGGDNP